MCCTQISSLRKVYKIVSTVFLWRVSIYQNGCVNLKKKVQVSCKTILRLHGNEGLVFGILVTVSIPCLLRSNKLNKIRKPNVSIIKGVGKKTDCSSSVANLRSVILWSMRRLLLWPSEVYAPINVKQAGGGEGGGRQGMGWGFDILQKFAFKFPPSLGCTLLSIPRLDPRKV